MIHVYVYVSLLFSGSDCQVKKVGITLKNEQWKSGLTNQSSIEFKTLESKLLSAVSVMNKYAKNIYYINYSVL